MATNSQRVAYNTIIQAAGKIIVAGLGAVSVAITTRYLGLDGYGQLTTALIYLSIFATITDSGISIIAIREISQSKRAKEEIIGNILALRILIALAAAVVALIGGFLIYGGAEQAPIRQAILFLSVQLLLGTLQNTLTSGLAARLRNDLIVVGDVVGKVVTVALIAYVASRDLGFTAILVVTLIGAAVNFVIDLIFGLRDTLPRLQIDRKYIRHILILSLPLGAAAILNTLYYRTDGFLLSLMKGSADVGLYGVAYKVVELTMAFAILYQNSIFPLFAASHEDRPRLLALTRKALFQANLFAAPIVVGVITLAPDVIRLFAGPEFLPAAVPLAILMIGNFFIYTTTVFGAALLAVNKQNLFIRSTGASLIFNLILNLILIPPYGVMGAAIAVAMTEVIILGIISYYYRQTFGSLPPYLPVIIPFLGCAAVMGFAIAGLAGILPPLPLIIKLGLLVTWGGAIYGGLVLSLRLVRLSEIMQLLRLRRTE